MILSVRDGNNWIEIAAIKGDTGPQGERGPAGPSGDDYIITATDYNTIASIVYNTYMTDATNVGY